MIHVNRHKNHWGYEIHYREDAKVHKYLSFGLFPIWNKRNGLFNRKPYIYLGREGTLICSAVRNET